jgi:hypothetical protein
MKKFYLLRHEDVNGNSGLGVVAEGVVWDHGMASMTWLTKYKTVTTFESITVVKLLHGHEGKTQLVVEGNRKDVELFKKCCEEARRKKDNLWTKNQSR